MDVGEVKPKKKLEREIELEQEEEYFLDLKSESEVNTPFRNDFQILLVRSTERYFDIPEKERWDTIPEVWNGHNIADYIDPEIFEVSNFLLAIILSDRNRILLLGLQRLKQMEEEEEKREKAGDYDEDMEEDDEEEKKIHETANE